MTFRIADLFRPDGTVGRLPYLLVGVIGFIFKFSVDHTVADLVFHRPWKLFYYWSPLAQVVGLRELMKSPADAAFLLTLAGLALPFIWIGSVMTLRRLRDADWPGWLVIFFFLPFVNLLFLALLCVVPSKAEPRTDAQPEINILDAIIPKSAWGSALAACFLTAILGLLCAWVASFVVEMYGWGLFVAVPFALGLTATLLYGYHEPRSMRSCLTVSVLAPLVLGGLLLLIAFEGLICVLMALPLALPLSLIGGAIGYQIQLRRWSALQSPALLSLVFLFVPGMIGLESAQHEPPQLFEVQTAIEINAPPKRVWRQVIAFSEIASPPDWIFRAGIAYPQRATIFGSGPGAVRHCVFSTGSFVEPITIWDEPRLLQFSVTHNPPPMHELSPYGRLSPPHLDGFLVSRQGQFRLEPLPGSRTRLEGTTWYHHGLWPAAYWRVWSDFLIHRIHRRVLEHIQREAEGAAPLDRAH
jgi:uncharacterized membrane protein YhaH (DUF805 family)